MPRAKSDREIVTHDELINLFRECKRMKCGAPETTNACRNRLECKFRTAIAEARTMGVLTVDLLIDLRNLVDPESGESICPRTLDTHLEHSIAHFMAIERKKEARVPQQATA
jgi:hypothetical protein